MEELAHEMGIRTWMLLALVVQALVLIFPIPSVMILAFVYHVIRDACVWCKKIFKQITTNRGER